MKRSILALVVVVLAGLLAVTPALAQDDDGHLYGLVFFDTNLNGVWDPGERGAPDVTVNLESADGLTDVQLASAPSFNPLLPEEDNVCDYLDPDAPTPCPGTWGLRPAGEPGWWWTVSVVPPSGYVVTSQNPQMVQVTAEGETGVVHFGLAPTGAGGPLLPETGADLGLLSAAGALMVAGLGFALKSLKRSR